MPKLALAQDEAFVTARRVLNRLMEIHEATEVQVSQAIGVSQQTMSDRRTGRSNLNLADIRRLADYFGVSPQEFFTEPCGSQSRGSPAGDEETAIAA